MAKKQKRIINKVVLLCTLILFGIVILVIILLVNKNQYDNTTNWIEFRDVQHHFSYKYPLDFIQTKDYSTRYASQFTKSSKDFVDFTSPVGQRTAIEVQYNHGPLFQNIKDIDELKKYFLNISNSVVKPLELFKIEEILIGEKPALVVVYKMGNNQGLASNYRSYYSIKGFVKINDNETLLISGNLINTPYDENFYKAFYSTIKFY